jgi:spore maturation protein SpmA
VVTRVSVLNYIWLALVLLAVAIGGWNDRLKDVTGGALDGAKTAVTIALGLRAMRDLESLNPRPGVASNAMCTFWRSTPARCN